MVLEKFAIKKISTSFLWRRLLTFRRCSTIHSANCYSPFSSLSSDIFLSYRPFDAGLISVGF